MSNQSKTKQPKPGTKADLKLKLDSAMQINSYLSRLSRAGLGRALGQSFGGERDLYATLGYAQDPEYIDYLNMYERDGLATRVVDSVADEVWREHPVLFESEEKAEDEKAEPGPLQEKFRELADQHDLWAQFNEIDRMLGISRFALLYLGLPGKPEDEVKGKTGKLAYVIACDEGTAEVDEASIITEPESERFGMPEFYSIAIDDSNDQRRRVHYTRVVHVKEGRQRVGGLGRVYGVPRLKKGINRLQDLEKVLGGGSEAYWLLIYRGMALMAKEGFTLPGKETDEYKAMQGEIDEYIHGLRRYIRLQGLDLQDLGGSPVDSRAQFDVIIEYIAGTYRIPQRVLLGSERGNLASSSDDANFMDYVDARRKNFAEPYILRPFLARCNELGILKVPAGYYVDWPSLFQLTDLEKADLAGKVATAMSSASGGAPETIMPGEEFAKRYLNFQWTPAMKREQAAAEEEAKAAEGGGGDGTAPPAGGNGNGSSARRPAGEFDLSQFRAAIEAFGDKVRMANHRAGQQVMFPGDRWASTTYGPVLMHNEDDNSVMVALQIPPVLRSELQEQYPIMDDETRDNLHITLAFLGDSRTIDIERAALAVFEFAQQVKPIKTQLQGVARFVSGGETDPIVTTIDSPDFQDFHYALCKSLDKYGVPYHKNHGFIPHMTLAYIPAGDPMPINTVEPLELNFSEVFLVDGGKWYGIELGFVMDSQQTDEDVVLQAFTKVKPAPKKKKSNKKPAEKKASK